MHCCFVVPAIISSLHPALCFASMRSLRDGSGTWRVCLNKLYTVALVIHVEVHRQCCLLYVILVHCITIGC